MKLEDYTYSLPDKLIADKPPTNRGESRLLTVNKKTNEIGDNLYKNLADFFQNGDVLVLNDTKVIKARLFVKKDSGAERELIVLERHSFDSDWTRHKVMYRGKIKAGDSLHIENSNAHIKVEEILGEGLATISSSEDLRDLCEKFGNVPLPPYMKRNATPLDIERYQTVFADEKGSVAAPTASLNFTDEIIQKLKNKGVKICYLTLHVGLGTFLPIRVEEIEKHKMHQEYFEIPASTIEIIKTAKKTGKKISALGTTVARTLEFSAEIIQKSKNCEKLTGEADIFIFPGYEFKIVDQLITNFHAPKSTVLMLVSAFAGWKNLKNGYEHAITQKYSFLSYGDSMIIF